AGGRAWTLASSSGEGGIPDRKPSEAPPRSLPGVDRAGARAAGCVAAAPATAAGCAAAAPATAAGCVAAAPATAAGCVASAPATAAGTRPGEAGPGSPPAGAVLLKVSF